MTPHPPTITDGFALMNPKKAASSHSDISGAERAEMSWWDREGMRSESEEYIVTQPPKAAMPLEIWESRRFDVSKNERDATFIESTIPQPNGMFAGREGTKTVVTARKSESEETSRS